jgi:uncharacterized membrane protein YfcA
MDGIWFWMAAAAAAVCVGAGKGGIPIVGMLSVPILSLTISPVTAAGLLLPVYVVSDMFGLWAYRRDFDARVLAIMLPGALVGIGVGWAAASVVPENWVRVLVGVIGITFALNLILRGNPDGPPRKAAVVPGLFWGAVSGFTSFVSHSGGPPYQVYTLPLKMSKTVFAGTSTIAFSVINAAKLIPYWHLGQLTAANMKLALMLMPIAAAAVFAGVWLVKILPDKLFFRLVVWALLILSVQLLWTGLRG